MFNSDLGAGEWEGNVSDVSTMEKKMANALHALGFSYLRKRVAVL